MGAKREHKQSKHKFDRKRVREVVKETQRDREKEEKLAKSKKKQRARIGGS